jgi:hypothetical protein
MKPSDLVRPLAPVPRGWKTATQWARQWKLTYNHTHKLLSEATRRGTIRRKKFLVLTPSGCRRVLPHYAEK